MNAVAIVLITLGIIILLALANGSWKNFWSAITGPASGIPAQ